MTDDPRPPKILENKPEEDLLFFEFTDDDERLMLVLEEAPVPLTVPLDVVPEAVAVEAGATLVPTFAIFLARVKCMYLKLTLSMLFRQV